MNILDIIQLLKDADLWLADSSRLVDEAMKVHSITYDSREISAGSLFFCKGKHFKPHYLKQAQNQGALAYVSEKLIDDEGMTLPYILVSDVRRAMAVIAREFYHRPDLDLKLTGITGTKGKTTVTHFLRTIFDLYRGHETAYLASNTFYDGVEGGDSSLTTPEALELYRRLDQARQAGLAFFTMEVSSQALKYDRVYGLNYDVACFINIANDHISPIEHPDFNDYFQSKLMLFKQARVAVINRDMAYYAEVKEALKASDTIEKVVEVSLRDPKADYYATDIANDESGPRFIVHAPQGQLPCQLSMAGEFNVMNALLAIAIAQTYAIPLDVCVEGLKTARAEGRMEQYFSTDKKVKVIVDFAHNALSFQSLFDAVKKMYPGHPYWIVFGSTGEKGLNRRYELAEIAANEADRIIITEEDRGKESIQVIWETMLNVIHEHGSDAICIDQREEAIAFAIREAFKQEEPVVVLITGKSDEHTIKIGDEYLPYPGDMALAKKYLAIYQGEQLLENGLHYDEAASQS